MFRIVKCEILICLDNKTKDYFKSLNDEEIEIEIAEIPHGKIKIIEKFDTEEKAIKAFEQEKKKTTIIKNNQEDNDYTIEKIDLETDELFPEEIGSYMNLQKLRKIIAEEPVGRFRH